MIGNAADAKHTDHEDTHRTQKWLESASGYQKESAHEDEPEQVIILVHRGCPPWLTLQLACALARTTQTSRQERMTYQTYPTCLLGFPSRPPVGQPRLPQRRRKRNRRDPETMNLKVPPRPCAEHAMWSGESMPPLVLMTAPSTGTASTSAHTFACCARAPNPSSGGPFGSFTFDGGTLPLRPCAAYCPQPACQTPPWSCCRRSLILAVSAGCGPDQAHGTSPQSPYI